MGLALALGAAADAVTVHLLRSEQRRAGGHDEVTRNLGSLRCAQLQAVLSLTRPMMSANISCAVAICILEMNVGHLHWHTLLWASLIFGIALRSLIYSTRRSTGKVHRVCSPRGLGKLVLSSVLIAFIWSYPVLSVMHGASDLEVAFVLTVTAGMVVGGAIALYPIPLASILYASILILGTLPAVAWRANDLLIPFILAGTAFLFVILASTRRQAGLFFLELNSRLDVERQRNLVQILLDTYHGDGDQCIWSSDENLILGNDLSRVGEIIRLPGAMPQAVSLFELFALAGFVPYDTGSDGIQRRLAAGDMSGLQNPGVRLSNGGGLILRVAGRPLLSEQGKVTGYRGLIKDVTAITKSEEEVRKLANKDLMTGLLNYTEFGRRGRALLENLRAGASAQVLFMFIDADNLKVINDSFGHAAGDNLILRIGAQIKALLPEDALVARKSGDEFLVMLACHDACSATALANQIVAALTSTFSLRASRISFSCSAGATISDARNGMETLELEADRALYHAKSVGRGRLEIYTTALGLQTSRDHQLLADFTEALWNEGLSVHFQPIMSGLGSVPVGAEALLRWRHNEFGWVHAIDIVALAQKAGMSLCLTYQALRLACRRASSWPSDAFVSVNINTSDLETCDFASDVLNIVGEMGFDPRRLWLEVREPSSAIVSTFSGDNIKILRSAGVVIAIDNVGAGKSNLRTFNHDSFDAVKIDGSMIADSASCASSRIILQSIHALARLHGWMTLAGGVETKEQLQEMGRLGFDYVQGYAYHRPMEPERIERLFRTTAERSLSACAA